MFNPKFPLNYFVEKKFNKGEIIKNEGDYCTSIGIIISGSASIINITYDNKEFLINSLFEGDMFGENLIFQKNSQYPGTIICEQNASIIFLSKTNFILFLQENIDFLSYYLNYISERFINMQNRLKILNQVSIKDKLLFFIESESKKNNSDFVYIPSQTLLAKYLNVPRPSLCRTIAALTKKGVIIKNKKIYKIKKA